VAARFLKAKAVWALGCASALGGATPPLELSIVSLVTCVQFEKLPEEKSSEKIPEVTVIGSDVGLSVGPLSNESTAPTV
jgi:hypothetical protein